MIKFWNNNIWITLDNELIPAVNSLSFSHTHAHKLEKDSFMNYNSWCIRGSINELVYSRILAINDFISFQWLQDFSYVEG